MLGGLSAFRACWGGDPVPAGPEGAENAQIHRALPHERLRSDHFRSKQDKNYPAIPSHSGHLSVGANTFHQPSHRGRQALQLPIGIAESAPCRHYVLQIDRSRSSREQTVGRSVFLD